MKSAEELATHIIVTGKFDKFFNEVVNDSGEPGELFTPKEENFKLAIEAIALATRARVIFDEAENL